jgi:hypothetical protein
MLQHLFLVAALAVAPVALAQSDEADDLDAKSAVTFPQVRDVNLNRELVSREVAPARYGAVLGWGQAITLSATQQGHPASVEIDYLYLLKQDPLTGRVTAVQGAALTFDHPIIYNTEGKLYERLNSTGNLCWMCTDRGTIPSVATNGVVTINVATMPAFVPHWWTARVNVDANTRYFVEARFRVNGMAAMQFGVDFWVDRCLDGGPCTPGSAYDEHRCQTANPCESWASRWIGDTGGQFITMLAVFAQPPEKVKCSRQVSTE